MKMTFPPRPIFLSALTVLAGAAAIGSAGVTGEPKAPSPADLSWLAGRWQSSGKGPAVVESWEPPRGGAMTGMCQLSANPRRPLYEFMLIAREGDDVVMRIRHFGAKLSAREAEALAYTLTECAKNRAVFERPADARFQKIAYQRTGDDELRVRLEGRTGDKVNTLAFRFQRTPLP